MDPIHGVAASHNVNYTFFWLNSSASDINANRDIRVRSAVPKEVPIQGTSSRTAEVRRGKAALESQRGANMQTF